MTHNAKKVSTGVYTYRGYLIELVSELGLSIQWNIFEAGRDCAEDCADTLRGAKFLIDQICG